MSTMKEQFNKALFITCNVLRKLFCWKISQCWMCQFCVNNVFLCWLSQIHNVLVIFIYEWYPIHTNSVTKRKGFSLKMSSLYNFWTNVYQHLDKCSAQLVKVAKSCAMHGKMILKVVLGLSMFLNAGKAVQSCPKLGYGCKRWLSG